MHLCVESKRRKLIQERQQRERDQLIAAERDRIGKELHDDLGGELSSILFLSQREARKQPSPNTSRIVELTKESIANMRDIIWALDGNDTTLKGLINYTQRYGTTMCVDRETNFNLLNKVAPVLGKMELSPRVRRNIFLIVKEAINNSLRHSQTSSIELSYAQDEGLLLISIRDTGIGFNTELPPSGNGLKNLKKRTVALNGELTLHSVIGNGTSIHVQVPMA